MAGRIARREDRIAMRRERIARRIARRNAYRAGMRVGAAAGMSAGMVGRPRTPVRGPQCACFVLIPVIFMIVFFGFFAGLTGWSPVFTFIIVFFAIGGGIIAIVLAVFGTMNRNTIPEKNPIPPGGHPQFHAGTTPSSTPGSPVTFQDAPVTQAPDSPVVESPEPEVKEEHIPLKYCEYCGKELKPGVKFCADCGAELPEA